jgi:hypothetical protein
MVMTSKQTVTTDMKNRTLQGGDSYPSCLAGIKGGQLRSHQFRSEVRRRRSDSAVNQRATKQSYTERDSLSRKVKCVNCYN